MKMKRVTIFFTEKQEFFFFQTPATSMLQLSAKSSRLCLPRLLEPPFLAGAGAVFLVRLRLLLLLTGRVAGAALFGWSRSRFFGPAPAPAPTLTHRQGCRSHPEPPFLARARAVFLVRLRLRLLLLLLLLLTGL